MAINLRTREGWQELKDWLDDHPDDVLQLCGLDVDRRKDGWVLLDDPMGDGRQNFGVCIRGGFLTWKQFAGTKRGRSLELIAYCKGWYDQPKRGADEAARLAVQRFGLGRISDDQLARDRAARKQRQAQRKADGEAERDRKTGAAFAAFVDAKPIQNTCVDTYLMARGIDMAAAPFLGPRGGNIFPGALRSIERCEHLSDDNRRTFWPAMIACCVDADMKIRAVHRTWINHTGNAKAPVIPQRKVWPDFAGCVIPLWNGEDNLPVRKACELGVLQTIVLTEGVEDGLSAVLANPKHRVWAAISLSNIANVAKRLPACCDSVIVHRQNDWNKPAAVAAFEAALAALRASGRAVAIVEAYDGKDLNDTLRGEN